MPQAEAYSTDAGRRLLRAIPQGIAELRSHLDPHDARIYANAWDVRRAVEPAGIAPGDLILSVCGDDSQKRLRTHVTGGRWRHVPREHFEAIRTALDAGHFEYVMGTWDRDDGDDHAERAEYAGRKLRGHIGRVLSQLRRLGRIKARFP
ncbi:MAG TPA: hypothetical protein VMM79_12965, partial [Longimicrobiales bacterium]|nr:hypothetical protein [Longimicrobiales bacterium]